MSAANLAVLATLLTKQAGQFTSADVDAVVGFASERFPFPSSLVRAAAKLIMERSPATTLQQLISTGELQSVLTELSKASDASMSVFAFCDSCQSPVETNSIYVEAGGKKAIVPCPMCDHLIRTTVN